MDLQIKTKTKLTNGDQYNRLVEFMVENPKLASYIQIKTTKDKMDYNKSWDDLTKQLNMKGPPIRTMEEWKKVWKDYKYHIKKKCYIKQKMEQNCIADGPTIYKKVNFNDNELAIINTLKLEALMPRSKKFTNKLLPVMIENTKETFITPVIKTELSEMVFDISEVSSGVDFIDTTSSSKCHLPNRDKTKTFPETQQEKVDQIEDQLEIEKQIRKLKMEKVNILRQTSELNQRHLELKEKIYQLKERKFEMKCKRVKDELEFKNQKLELKKRELELKEAAKLCKEWKFKIEN